MPSSEPSPRAIGVLAARATQQVATAREAAENVRKTLWTSRIRISRISRCGLGLGCLADKLLHDPLWLGRNRLAGRLALAS